MTVPVSVPANYVLPPALFVEQRLNRTAAPVAIVACAKCAALVLISDVGKHDTFHSNLGKLSVLFR